MVARRAGVQALRHALRLPERLDLVPVAEFDVRDMVDRLEMHRAVESFLGGQCLHGPSQVLA